eukprot:1799191-Ditylum_brightwellii.AAC.1
MQDITKKVPSYLANSKKLKEELITLNLPPGAHLFTANATLMYTNIKTKQAIASLGEYLMENQETFRYLPITAIRDALNIIMKYNIFTFGDAHFLQLIGPDMGTLPAPTYATTTLGTHEICILRQFILRLLLYRRYIDDFLGIWVPPDNLNNEATEWRAFWTLLNMWFGME